MSGSGEVSIDEVADRATFRRFLQLPYRLHSGTHAAWRSPLPAGERRRFTPRTNPFFDHGDAAYFVARRGTADVGRITAHVRSRDAVEGWFGFFEVDVAGEDDGGAVVTGALLARARRWLGERGCELMRGPAGFTPEEEAGVLVSGHDHPVMTARTWNPESYPVLLAATGLDAAGEQPTHVLPVEELAADLSSAVVVTTAPAPAPVPAGWAATGDPRLSVQIESVGTILAVPDTAGAVDGAGLVGAWRLARRVRTFDWEGAVVIALDGAPEVLVPALAAAASAAGYRWIATPWAPDDRPPTLVHRTFTTRTT